MEASCSTSSSVRRKAPMTCYHNQKPILVVAWTEDNPGRRWGESVGSSNGVMMRYVNVVRLPANLIAPMYLDAFLEAFRVSDVTILFLLSLGIGLLPKLGGAIGLELD
ncbi:hypothetical protein SO802_027392 [Lithocarpus litseifolius]|uniref:Uncharacterized protein n=1 Tax=Lithocarpus litseifolius TaxID=425828 RepID=A0AAW2C4B0_9ROSI